MAIAIDQQSDEDGTLRETSPSSGAAVALWSELPTGGCDRGRNAKSVCLGAGDAPDAADARAVRPCSSL